MALSCREVTSCLVLNDLVLIAPRLLPGTFRATWLRTGLVAATLLGVGLAGNAGQSDLSLGPNPPLGQGKDLAFCGHLTGLTPCLCSMNLPLLPPSSWHGRRWSIFVCPCVHVCVLFFLLAVPEVSGGAG